MRPYSHVRVLAAVVAALAIGASTSLAHHEHEHGDQHKHDDKPAPKTGAGERVGDPYPLDTCPITGKKLGTMGDPVVKIYDGREVRFYCPACPEKFEKDLAENLKKLDEQIIKDQGPLYPLKTSVVTDKDLPAKPYEFVYGNRLARLGAESEKAEFLKDATKYFAELDKATIVQQGQDYSLSKCPVSGEELGGDMGKPVDTVVTRRLIRLCCAHCKKDIEKDPAKYIHAVDAARTGDKKAPATNKSTRIRSHKARAIRPAAPDGA